MEKQEAYDIPMGNRFGTVVGTIVSGMEDAGANVILDMFIVSSLSFFIIIPISILSDIMDIMSDRFQNFFDSMVYTGIHLTGDYPIITYSWPGRVVNFFMVIAAVGIVSIPSGLIASGFVENVHSKNINKKRGNVLDDDWYEVRYRSLEGTEAPVSFGTIDRWQVAVDRFLNGQKVTAVDDRGETYQRTEFGYWAYCSRIFIFAVIILNVFAVLLESIPKIDKYVGNERGNFFDTFELFSVLVFATEYMLRLFSAPKNREALYSTVIYATTFLESLIFYQQHHGS
jgi:hypothetical protein